MNVITEADFRNRLKENPSGGYLFFGAEDYLKFHAIEAARKVVCPDPTFQAFNEMKLDPLTFSPDKLVDALMPLPMMADQKLVVVSGLVPSAFKKDELEDLLNALSLLKEYDYNLLILSIPADGIDLDGYPKKTPPLLAKLAERLTPVSFDPPTDAKLAIWVGRHLEHLGIAASVEDCRALIDFCGHSMFTLSSEIEKLAFYLLSQGKTRFERSAMELVCTAACEYDAFAFTNALMNRQPDRALYILQDYRFRRMEPVMILHSAVQVVCDMIAVKSATEEGLPNEEISKVTGIHTYKVGLYQKSLARVEKRELERLLAACLAADRSLKGYEIGYAPLERLICSL